jgi:hypothetical protein
MRTMKKVKKVVLRSRLSLDRNRLNGDPYPFVPLRWPLLATQHDNGALDPPFPQALRYFCPTHR